MYLLRRLVTSGSELLEPKNQSESSKLVRKFGRKGKGKGQFNMPCGIAVTKSGIATTTELSLPMTPRGTAIKPPLTAQNKGDIVVADSENHRIQIFGSEGTFKHKFGSRGTEESNLCYPLCVAMTTDDCIAVTDSVNAYVKVFNQNGDYQHKFGGNNFFEFPYGIAITYDNFLVITDICKHCVFVLYPSGGICKTFGSYGSDPQEFDHPYFVAVNKEKQIIVSDSGNCSVKIFQFEGKLLRHFSTNDFRINETSFFGLQGLCTDSQGNSILICNSTAYIVTKNGRLWEVLTANDGLNYPKCIAFSESGRLVVTQSATLDKHEVAILEYKAEDFKSLNSLLLYAISV